MSRTVKDYFEQVSTQWDALRKGFYGDEVRDAVLNAVKVGPNETVLDVGAGTGFLTEAAAKVARKVIALDFSKSMTDEAISKLNGKNVEFKLGSVERIPLADSSVEIVVGNMILHHCPNPAIVFNEIARVLKTGGRVALSDMQEHNQEWLRTEKADVWLGFNMKRVQQMMETAGLKAVRVGTLGACCSTNGEGKQVEIPMFLAYGEKSWQIPTA